MKVRNYHKIEKRDAYLQEKGKDVSLRVAISKEDGAQKMCMRIYEIDPGGYTPLHEHDWEHSCYVVKGSGVVCDGKKENRLEKDDVLLIPANDIHQIKNTGDQIMVVVSVIPIKDD